MHELMHGNCIIHVYPLVSVPKRSLLNNSIKPEFISMQNQNSEKESLQKRKKRNAVFFFHVCNGNLACKVMGIYRLREEKKS
jgi:hypothetical protein